MKRYDDVCYKKTFVNQVILRLDFMRYVSPEIVFNEELENVIFEFFPKRGKDQIIRFNAINITFDANENRMPSANGQSVEGLQKEYYSTEGNKLIISNIFIAFEINKYSIFDKHMKWFQEILHILFSKGKVITKRTGLRYINMFRMPQIRLHKKYFNNNISATLIVKQEENANDFELVRSMHTNEYRADNFIVNFRYGMYNPEYPNVLKNNSFVLDYDCFSEDVFENAEQVLKFVDVGHEMIQTLFEDSITDSLRKVMRDE